MLLINIFCKTYVVHHPFIQHVLDAEIPHKTWGAGYNLPDNATIVFT